MRIGTFAVLAAFLLLGGCPAPIYESTRLAAIKAESERLMATRAARPAQSWGDVPRSQWPPAIASVHPEIVLVGRNTVYIIVVPFFDGGWGYQVARAPDDLRMSPECYQPLPHGVYWHDPC